MKGAVEVNTVTKRAYVLLGVIAAFMAGIIILGVSFFVNGGTWATNRFNGHLYSAGQITNAGTIYDRNGVVLAESKNGERIYNSDATIRKATLHSVGDTYGYIAHGAHTLCRDKLTGYSFVNGIYDLINTGEGSDVKLTIDAKLCATAYKALGNNKGAVGVYNYKTGEIVCMVSSGSYDPENKPDDIETNDKYEAVYMNRLLTGLYTPGSIFKTVTTVCALENLPDVANRTSTCTGALKTEQGGEIICNNTHGEISFGTALTKSCNSAYAELGIELGKKKLETTAENLGFGKSFNISGVKTQASRIDLSDAVEIDTGWAAIGQYTTLVNPLHMMMLAGAIAAGGTTPTPYFVSENLEAIVSSVKTNSFMSQTTADTLKTMMRNNVINNYGDYRFPDMDFGGKTGTAQVAGEESHAWFMGFSSNSDFPYAIIVVAENGGGGSDVAVPIASTVMKALKS